MLERKEKSSQPKIKKTVKISCIVTGKTFLFNRSYFDKKVEKIGTEEKLRETYICREASHYLKRGYSIEKTREILGVDVTTVGQISEEIVNALVLDCKKPISRLNISNYSLDEIETGSDPAVVEYINNITANG
tara:strand:+ start:2993 stop:3391 length:399 start_codon:yes stop_codon:yes gene_type:complete